ncbi:MAG TPA: T9SS type A sorting domain-containing protein, partial [Rhodothermales bacterium]|nr:T9SS type A sorting domain-containing protein [Rhodothermales bacterium]
DRAWKEVDSLGVYVGRPAAVAHLRLHLAGEGLESTAPVALFLADAANGADRYDGTWLRPLSADYAALFFVAPETGRRLVFDARPAAPDGQALGLAVETSRGGTYTLTWPDLGALPDGPVSLTDTETGRTIDLRTTPSYTFDAAATAAPHTPGGPADLTGAAATPRFVLQFGAVTAGAPEAPPAALTLRAPAPNPVRHTATLRYGLPGAGSVRVVVYDALGRAVATLAEGERTAGWHEARLDASALATGLYIVRLETAGGSLVQRMTVAR